MYTSKDQIVSTLILGSIFLLVLIGVIVITALLYYNRRKAHQMAVSQFQNILLHTQLEIQEQTFKTISQEIHDNIGQMLSLAKLNLSKYAIDPATAGGNVTEAENLVSKAVNGLRDLSKTLNTDTISQIGLLASIKLELEAVNKASGLHTDLKTSGKPVALSPDKELIVFRIIQEGLHNGIKHATGARQICVTADYSKDDLRISITDDGCGIKKDASLTEGSGLRNMQSRSTLIGAKWSFESAPQKGTTMHLTIPLYK